MSAAPDFSDAELHQIKRILTQLYQKDVEIHLADGELVLKKGNTETTTCPSVFWYVEGANFVVFKTGISEYRTQFFYTPHDQFSTDIETYHNLDECVIAVLRAQSNHERKSIASDSITETHN